MGKERTGPGAGCQVDRGVTVPARTAAYGRAQVSRETPSARDGRSYTSKRQADFQGLSSGVVFDTGASSSTSPRRREFLCRSPRTLDWSQKTVGCSRDSCTSASQSSVSAHKVLCLRCRLCHSLARLTRCAGFGMGLVELTAVQLLWIASMSSNDVFGMCLSLSRALWCSHTQQW